MGPKKYKPASRAAPSPAVDQKSRMREMMKQTDLMMREVGILPETFVSCRWSDRPSLMGDFRGRLEYERARIKAWFLSAYGVAVVKFYAVRTKTPEEVKELSRMARWKYRLFEWYDCESFKLTRLAQELYGDMYVALAEGRLEGIKSRLKPGIYASLEERVTVRGKNATARWEVLKWNRQPTLRSISATLVKADQPKWKQSLIQQAVVEFDSVQSLRRYRVVPKQGKDGRAQKGEDGKLLTETVEEPSTPRNVREYMVIQKNVIEGVEGPWMVWGMTHPTTVGDIRDAYRRRMGLKGEPSN